MAILYEIASLLPAPLEVAAAGAPFLCSAMALSAISAMAWQEVASALQRTNSFDLAGRRGLGR